jgi:hypothetical protein
MDFIHYDLGPLHAGSIVHVDLGGNAATVQLLDTPNLHGYRTQRAYWYEDGGCFAGAPADLSVPRDARWHVVIELDEGPEQLAMSVEVLPPELVPA